MRTKKIKIPNSIHRFGGVITVFVLSLLFFVYAAYYNHLFIEIMSVATFLTWHNLFEFISILAGFSIFIVAYYTYEESGSIRVIILGCAFLAMGILDIFHTLSYKGMADFFISNTSANRATTLWILSRMIGSIGILTAVLIPVHSKRNFKRWIFVVPTCITVIMLFLLTTYYPGLFPPMFIDGEGLTRKKVLFEYVIILFMGTTFLKVSVEFGNTNSRQDYLLMLGLLLSIFSELAFVSYASVYDAYNYLGHLYKIIAYFIMFKAIYTENVKIPYREMTKAKNQLSEYSQNLNLLVQQRTKDLEDMNRKLLMDLEYAKEIQLSLLPAKMPQDMSVSFDAAYFPAEQLSGDFYNVIKLDESNIAIYIGDVAGHGVSAAMITVFANQNIRPLKETEETLEIITPGFVVKSLYKAFNKTNFKEETYLVMLYGIYNTKSRCFTYASGGINVPPLIIKNTGEVIEMDVNGFAICKLGDVIMPFFEDRMIQLESGDTILFYTDGLVEAENVDGCKYTQERLIDVINKNHSLRQTDLSDAVKKDLFQYIGSEEKPKDDITFLVMEVH